MPFPSLNLTSPPAATTSLVTAGLSLFTKCGGSQALPCTRLALGATDFIDSNCNQGNAITNFFTKKEEAKEGPIHISACRISSQSTGKDVGGKRKLGTILSFLKQENIQEEEEPPKKEAKKEREGPDGGEEKLLEGEEFTKCKRCGCRIAIEHEQEHLDWHFASELQESLRKEGGDTGNGTPGGGDTINNSRVASSSRHNPKANQRIDSFFGFKPR